ncbi:FtsK/SpoIIIE domain-containing protein, partial [Helicobacter pylori]
RMRNQTSQVIASLILFEKNNTGFRANSWGDMPLSVFKNLDHSPYLFNFHNQEVKHKGVLAHNVARVVGHTMIIGATGAGKTTLISYLMMSALKYSNIDILALDRLNGLYSFTKYFDGIYNQGENFHINPFSLEDSATNRAFLLHFYAQMAKVDSYDDHKDKVEDRTALLNAIDTMYRNYNDEVKQAKFSNQELPLPFDLKEFVNAIVKTNTDILDSSFEDYLKSSLFSSRMDSLDFKTRISTINTDSILHNDDNAGLLAYYVFHKMIDRALKINRGFLCFIDEFKSYAQNEMMNKKINEIITQARKANGVIVLALQDINQLTEVRNAQSFIKNMGQLILYPQRNIDTKDLNDKFGIRLSDTEKHFLENTAVNEYKVLLKNMNDGSSNIIDVNLSSLGNYLQIFSSNSSMVEHIENLIKHYPTTWREVFVNNTYQKFDDKKHLEKVLA